MVTDAVMVAIWLFVGVAALIAGLFWLRSVEKRQRAAGVIEAASRRTVGVESRTEADAVTG
jgi:hypothetical protein